MTQCSAVFNDTARDRQDTLRQPDETAGNPATTARARVIRKRFPHVHVNPESLTEHMVHVDGQVDLARDRVCRHDRSIKREHAVHEQAASLPPRTSRSSERQQRHLS